MNMLLLITLILVTACSSQPLGDRKLKSSEIPAFLSQNTPKQAGIKSLEYFEQRDEKGLTYEIKYREAGQEVSLSYDEEGRFLEEERDIEFRDLKTEVQNKVKNYLASKYQTYRITETELRLNQEKKAFIDVEISDSEGFLEVSFDENGHYVSEKVEHEDWIDTIN